MKNKFVVVTGIVIALLVAGYLYNKYRVAPRIQFEKLQLTTLDGQTVAPESFKDHKVFFNFFATWCGPCVKEIPSLDQAQLELNREQILFFLVSDEPIEVLKKFKERSGTTIEILHSNKKLRDLKIATVPTSYLLNEKMEILFKQTGEADWASPEMIEKLKKTGQ